MSHVAEYGKGEFLQRPVCFDDTLEKRYNAVQSSILLPWLTEPAQIVHDVQYLIRDLPEMRKFHAGIEKISQDFYSIGVLQSIKSSRQH